MRTGVGRNRTDAELVSRFTVYRLPIRLQPQTAVYSNATVVFTTIRVVMTASLLLVNLKARV